MRTTEGTTVTGATTEVASVVAGSAVRLKELQGERVFQGVRDLGCKGSAAPLTSARDRRGASERGASRDLILRTHPHHPRVLEFWARRTLQGVAPPASYLGREPPGSAAEAETGAVGRPRTVKGGAVRRSSWTVMWSERAPVGGEACEHHNIPRLRARFRLLVCTGPWSGQGALGRLR